MKRRYNQKIVVIRVDGETSLGGDFYSWMNQEGITVEQSAPYTKSQNGSAERSEELWPEIVRAAAYLINRTPNAQLSWMTPFKKL